MDLRTAVKVAALLLLAAGVCVTHPNINNTISPENTTESCSCCPNGSVSTVAPTSSCSSSVTVQAFLTIRLTSKCLVEVKLYHLSNHLPVCYNSETVIKSLLTNVCKNNSGCKGAGLWKKSKNPEKAYNITESGAQLTDCETLRVQCEVQDNPNFQGQLQAYKVMTALLCCVLVVILLIRFTRPTVKALQKRLSDRRQNRWIGPTQSHSVSYQRGKTVSKSDGEKRLSYPALERLAVMDSREPSSNRNSGYNL